MERDETPHHNYTRQRTDEMRPDQLTNHRLKSLEDSVRDMTERIADSHTLLGEINTRLAVGGERIETTEKRLASLEGNQRWIVLSFITGAAGLVWQALSAIFTHGKVPLITACVLLVSCIPVTIYPARDDQGRPQAIPVTPVGTVKTPAGDFPIEPIYPVSDAAPESPTIPWGTLGAIGLGLLGVGGGGFAMRAVGIANKAKTALKIACSLADQLADAPDDEAVGRAKRAAFLQQQQAGVHAMTQEARDKPT